MIRRKWDVHNINGKYLSTDFVVSDEKIEEGGVVSMRSITLQKKDEYRIMKDNAYLIELNGSTSVRKATTNVGCFVRHPFHLMEFICYLNVGKSAHPKTGLKTLDFPLTNERGRTLRVTLWGKLGDELLKIMSGHSGNYIVILTSISVKYYNGKYKDLSTKLILLPDVGPSLPYTSAWHIQLFIYTYFKQ
ncbi:replication protein A 70 kDa DNA-binding subunit C-like protein [Tanacetum coccineum]